MVKWKECVPASQYFITEQTYLDLICSCDAMVLYFLVLKDSFPDAHVVPQFLTSDICELVFSFIRIGRYSGRRTNVDAITLALGLEARNKKSEMSVTSDVCGQFGHSRGRTILHPTVPLDDEESLTDPIDGPTPSVCKGRDISTQGMIEALNQGSRDCMADIERAGLPFFDIVNTHKPKRRKVEISPFVRVAHIEDDDEDFSEVEDLTNDDPVCEVVNKSNTVKTPLGNLDSSQADRIYLNAGGIQFNNQSRKGRVATKSRRRVFEDTAFSTYLNPGPKCCSAALSRGDSTVLRRCVSGKATNIRIRGTVRFISRKLTPVSVACRIHDKTDVNVWLWDAQSREYIRCLF